MLAKQKGGWPTLASRTNGYERGDKRKGAPARGCYETRAVR
jgi:hypothetical protein